MTPETQQRRSPRWVLACLAALVAALVTLFGAGVASAAPAAQTRGGAPSVESQVVLGHRGGIDADRRFGRSTSTYDSVLALGQAAEDPVAVVSRAVLGYGYDAAPIYDASWLRADVRTLVQVEAASRDTTAVSFLRHPGVAAEGSGSISGFVVAAKAVPGSALRPVGKVFVSLDDVMANPSLLAGKSAPQVESMIGKTPGWRVESLGQGSRKGEGWLLRQYNEAGNPTGPQIRWHPGGGHHGPDPYWRVVGPNGDLGGIIR